MRFRPKYLWMLAATAACVTAAGITLTFYLSNSNPPPAKNETVAIRTPADSAPETKPKVPARIYSDEDYAKLNKEPFMYSPSIAVGNKKYIHEKNFIIFEWSAIRQESSDAFIKFVTPLIHQLATDKSSAYAIIIRQRFEDKKDSLGPGGLLLCPKDSDQYALLATDYLLRGKNVSKLELLETKLGNSELDREVKGALKKTPHYTNATTQIILQELGINVSKCLTDGEYNFRVVKAMGKDIGLTKVLGAEKLPYFGFPDGSLLQPSDPRLPKKIEQITKTQPKP